PGLYSAGVGVACLTGLSVDGPARSFKTKHREQTRWPLHYQTHYSSLFLRPPIFRTTFDVTAQCKRFYKHSCEDVAVLIIIIYSHPLHNMSILRDIHTYCTSVYIKSIPSQATRSPSQSH
ncbi:hypothetical protein HaLaN_15457, partial [Haematococcus lacustris]